MVKKGKLKSAIHLFVLCSCGLTAGLSLATLYPNDSYEASLVKVFMAVVLALMCHFFMED